MTTFELDEYVHEAIRAGASGFLGKGVDPDELILAIRTIAAGDALLSPRATRALISRYAAHATSEAAAVDDAAPRLAALTDREQEVVALVVHRAVEHVWALVEDGGGPIAVVSVYVDHRDPLIATVDERLRC